MSKSLVLLVLGLCLIHDVFGLDCYISDLQDDDYDDDNEDGEDLTYLQNCHEYYSDMFITMGLPNLKLSTTIPTFCYTVYVDTDEGDFETKGCMKENSCSDLERIQKDKFKGLGRKVKNVTCNSCSTNGCNKKNQKTCRK